jgi:hypothetical protein
MTDISTSGVIPPNGAVQPLSLTAHLKVNEKRCRNCCYGPESFCTLEARQELEHRLGSGGVMLCHNSGAVVCRGYYDTHTAQIEAAHPAPVEFVDVPDKWACAKPIPHNEYKYFGEGTTMNYGDQVAEAKQRSADHEKHEALHRDERNALIAEAAVEVFDDLQRQLVTGELYGSINVTSSRPPREGRFGLELIDRVNQIEFNIAGDVEWSYNLDDVHRRNLRAGLATRVRHLSSPKEVAQLNIVIYHFREDGTFEIDLSFALGEMAKRLLANRT